MSSDDVGNLAEAEAEIRALTAVVQALRGIPATDQRRIIDAALVLLGSPPSLRKGSDAGKSGPSSHEGDGDTRATDIRQLADSKKPGSASEMAALVAYYLSEIAGDAERTPEVETSDMEKYFKQARFRLPASPKMTLVHAKNAGYFDAIGGGKYKLNPVGYNLVAHTLPRANGVSEHAPRSTRGRPGPKKKR